jgi:DNA-binding NarL/FixJ family response regulator
LDVAAVRHLTALSESEPKPLKAVSLECRYPVVALALKEILKEEADVYEGIRQPLGAKDPSCIILCSNGKDVASEVRRLGASNPQAAVLVFDMPGDPWLVQKALRAGASGFLHAGMQPEQIVDAVRLAAEGNAVVPERLLESPLLEEQQPAMADLTVLTPRQREIIGLVCEGLSNAQIAKRLFVTESTIKQHLRTAYKLLKVRNRVQAAKLLR